MKNSYQTPTLKKSMLKLHTSWSWVDPEFAEEFRELNKIPETLTPAGPGEVIWQTRNKYVLRLTVPGSGRKIVYKTTPKIKRAHQFCHRRSPFGNEAWFYQYFSGLGLPMAKLLAAGDVRKNFILKSGFLVTEFVENCRDGRDFCPDGIFAERTDLRNEFICQNLTFLAKLHKMRILHRGSTPANFLYRLTDDTLEIIWIDVASCHHVPWLLPLRSGIKRDLELLLKPFKLSSEEQQKYMEYYSRQKQTAKP